MDGPWTRIEVGLVLQGGGALGAYEWGAIDALFALMDEVEARGTPIVLKVVTGVSIGAINGACVVGATDRHDGLCRLAALWNDLKLETPFHGRIDLSRFGLPSIAPVATFRCWGCRASTRRVRTSGTCCAGPASTTLSRSRRRCESMFRSTHIDKSPTDVRGHGRRCRERRSCKRFRNKRLSAAQQARRPPSTESKSRTNSLHLTRTTSWQAAASRRSFRGPRSISTIYWDGGHRRQHAARRCDGGILR